MNKVFILLGPPGCGKGTQTEKLSKKLNLPHIDTGSLLRKNITDNTELGVEAKKYMDKGELVPIDLVVRIIKNRLSENDTKNGYILDGYPRSVEQGEALEKMQKELGYAHQNVAIYFDVPTDVLVERLVNRRSCSKCGKIYNLLTIIPKNEGKCDVCGADLIQRADDNEETARSRFKTYEESTKPLLNYFSNKGILKQVNANAPIGEVWAEIEEIIA